MPRRRAQVRRVSWPTLAIGILLLALWVGIGSVDDDEGPAGPAAEAPDSEALAAAGPPFEQADMPAFADVVSRLWAGEKVDARGLPAGFRRPSPAVYVAVRSKGHRLHQGWRTDETVLQSLATAIGDAREQVGERGSEVDTVEIDFAHGFRARAYPEDKDGLTANEHRGVRGLEVSHGGKLERFAPTWLLATNRKIGKQLKLVREKWGIDEAELGDASIRTFEAQQVLVHLGTPPRATLMERGNVYVPVEEVSAETTRQLVQLQAEWLLDNLHPDGRMTYMYWPSVGKEAPAKRNNLIRQWMATVALVRLAAEREDDSIWDAAERNIDYNLGRYYRTEGDLGLIERQGKVKLGALALATYAIVSHRKREKWSVQEAAMRRTIDRLWHDDGSFSSYFRKPPSAKEQQNFYPGEALLLWAELYEREQDPRLLERFMKSFRHYRKWHLDERHRNPAFVPWHTQACFHMYRLTRDEELAAFIFEMNDWLVRIQQWDDAPYQEARGRFYAEGRDFGPPHSSSTGVYLEGLIDVYRLAQEVGDKKRMESYRTAIVRGLRSVMQLQFVDEIDMFYVHDRRRVRGGIRTTVYDNVIRCDNVQHTMMAGLEILRTFTPEDYRLSGE